MIKSFTSPAMKERRLIYGKRLNAGFGVTMDDNSIHTENNNGAMDTTLGAATRIARHTVDFGNNIAATITGKQRRHAYEGAFGASRARAMDVISTPVRLITERNRIGTLVNGVMSGFDFLANAAVVDPLTMAAGDHANKPHRKHLQQFTEEQQKAAPGN